MCIASTDGYFLKLNREWEKALGYQLADLEHKRFLDLVHPEDFAATIEQLTHLGQGDEVLSLPIDIATRWFLSLDRVALNPSRQDHLCSGQGYYRAHPGRAQTAGKRRSVQVYL
ncbi:MAG: PAS domain-containing protein [Candidatus Cloacimonetes bacterium]|nr:PAS domain-containing protein [Candidatus Cloacimonadota bacterium]